MNIREKTKSLSRTVFFALLAGVLAIGGIGYKMLKSLEKGNKEKLYNSKLSRLKELDRQAETHFRKAREYVPHIVKTLCSPKNVLKLCCKFAYDKVTGKKTAQTFMAWHIRSVTEECRKAAGIYGVNVDSPQFTNYMMEAVGGHATISVFSIGGLGMEAVMLKSTLSAAGRICASVSAKLAGTAAASTATALADGPLPVGDIIAVGMAAGGTAMCIGDLIKCYREMPQTLTQALYQIITSCRESCRKVYMQ